MRNIDTIANMAITRVRMIDTTRTENPVPARGRSRGIPPALERYEVKKTRIIHEAVQVISQLFGEHSILVGGQDAANFGLTYHAATLKEISFGYFDYRVRVELRNLKVDSYYLFMPTSGSGTFQLKNCELRTSTIGAFIANPGTHFDLKLEPDSPHLFLRISPKLVEHQISRALARTPTDPVQFDCSFDLSNAYSWRWHTAVQLLHEELYAQDSLSHNPLRISALEEYLVATLLLLQSSNYSTCLQPVGIERSSRTLRLAIKYMQENLDQDITLEEIASNIGISPRSIQKAFREELHSSPMTYLRDLRLDRIQLEILSSPDKMIKIGTVARKWGMNHYGRFAKAYKDRYGESPSETLDGLG